MKSKTVNNLGGVCVSLYFAMMVGGVGELLEWSRKDNGILMFSAFMVCIIFWFISSANSDFDDEWDAQ